MLAKTKRTWECIFDVVDNTTFSNSIDIVIDIATAFKSDIIELAIRLLFDFLSSTDYFEISFLYLPIGEIQDLINDIEDMDLDINTKVLISLINEIIDKNITCEW